LGAPYQAQFEPIRITERLWVIPSWHVAPDPAAINLIVDPGLAFGTGSHPTTQTMPALADAGIARGESVPRLWLRLGNPCDRRDASRGGSAMGTDVDPQALVAARANAELNSAACRFHPTEALPEGQFDIVVANILTNPLRMLAPALSARVREGGPHSALRDSRRSGPRGDRCLSAMV
jgi:ribosomal protein L11 methyltransferase